MGGVHRGEITGGREHRGESTGVTEGAHTGQRLRGFQPVCFYSGLGNLKRFKNKFHFPVE